MNFRKTIRAYFVARALRKELKNYVKNGSKPLPAQVQDNSKTLNLDAAPDATDAVKGVILPKAGSK